MSTSETSSNTTPTDAELVGAALAGQRQAFNQLIVRYERRLFRFLASNTVNQSDAEDVMQQALVKAYVNLHRYNPRWQFTTWLFTIAVRELRSLARRAAPRTKSLDHAADHAAPPVVAASDESDLWTSAGRLLSPGQYTMLWLRYGEDLPVRDIAVITRRPRVWVSVNLHRACAILRKHVTPRGELAGDDHGAGVASTPQKPLTPSHSRSIGRGRESGVDVARDISTKPTIEVANEEPAPSAE